MDQRGPGAVAVAPEVVSLSPSFILNRSLPLSRLGPVNLAVNDLGGTLTCALQPSSYRFTPTCCFLLLPLSVDSSSKILPAEEAERMNSLLFLNCGCASLSVRNGKHRLHKRFCSCEGLSVQGTPAV